MPKLTKKAIRHGRSDGQTDPNNRKASLLKTYYFDDSNPYIKVTERKVAPSKKYPTKLLF